MLKTSFYSCQKFQDNLTTRQPDYDQIMRSSKRRQLAAEPNATRKHETPSKVRPSWGKTRIPRNAPSSQPVFSRGHSFTRDKSPARAHLAKHWQHLWLLSLERLRKIQERLDYITQKRLAANFSFEEWKKRVSQWLSFVFRQSIVSCHTHHNNITQSDAFILRETSQSETSPSANLVNSSRFSLVQPLAAREQIACLGYIQTKWSRPRRESDTWTVHFWLPCHE